jgi:hypothetical protein
MKATVWRQTRLGTRYALDEVAPRGFTFLPPLRLLAADQSLVSHA